MKNKTIYQLRPILFKRAFFAALLSIGFCLSANAQPGANDPTFNPGDIGFGIGDGASNSVTTTAIQSDGKVIIGGFFSTYNGTTLNRIARLNADGRLDAAFNLGTGASHEVYTTAIQNDGKIILGGAFTTYNGTPRMRIARLNTDGTIDAAFNPGTGANGYVYTAAIQSDGRIIIGGWFTSFNGATINRIARLNADGTLDAAFNPGAGANGTVQTIAIQIDGKIIIGGGFTSYNGTSVNRIARLNANGTLDATFNTGTGANGNPRTIAIQNDGKIIIGGEFTSYNGSTVNRIARLNANGTLDATFNTGIGVNDYLYSTAIQSDGKIIIVGNFSSYNGSPRNRIARLNTDGTLDAAFITGTGANFVVNTTAIQSDGNIIIGGDFTSYNGIVRNRIARLNANGTMDAGYNPSTGANSWVWTTAIQNDGKIIIGGGFNSYNGVLKNYVTRLNSDGTLDATFNTGVGANYWVYKTTLQSDGKIIIAGAFTSYNGTTSNFIARLNADGTLDATFNSGTGANGYILTTAIQSDGKIIIGGDFTSYNGIARRRIARLNVNGMLDATFDPGTGASDIVRTTTIQSDGKIIIGGSFLFFNGYTVNRIVRLDADGTIDFAFNPGTGANNYVFTTTIQSDGKIIIGGAFSSYNGITVNGIARLNANGMLDATFNSGAGVDFAIRTTALHSNGKIIIGGDFTSYNGTTRNFIARLNADGTLDAGFNPGTGASSYVYSTAIQSDGKIIIGGDFTSYNGTGRNRVARIFGDPVGINSYQTKAISIYPNPVTNELNIESKGNTGELNFEVFNIFGQEVFKGNFIEKTTIQTADYTPGVYLVKVGSDKGYEIKKIIKE